MNPLIERIQQVQDLPVWWLIEAINRTTRYTDTEKEQAMRYVRRIITAGDLGEEQEEIEFVPLPEPAEAPVQEPAAPTPAEEPVPA